MMTRLNLKLLASNWKFWASIFSIWGIVWSVAEGALFVLQQTGLLDHKELGYFILLMLAGSAIVSGALNWPMKKRSVNLIKQGVTINLVYGDFWAQEGEKIIAVTRCFSSNVDNVEIHKSTLHGQFITRNFQTNQEARIRFDSELNGTQGPYPAGKTIKIAGNKDTAYLVGLTQLDVNNIARVSLDEYFTALNSMWQFIEDRNGGVNLVCPLIGAGRSRLNHSSAALFRELLNSALSAINSGYITNSLTFVVYPNDVKTKQVDIEEFTNIFTTLCELENMQKIESTTAPNSVEI